MPGPEDALKMALGGDAPQESSYDLAAAVLNATPGAGGYSSDAEYVAKMIMQAAARDPEAFASASEAYRKDPYGDDIENLMTSEEKQSMAGISGFMWGWAVNAAFTLTEQPGGPNPALISF